MGIGIPRWDYQSLGKTWGTWLCLGGPADLLGGTGGVIARLWEGFAVLLGIPGWEWGNPG